MGGNVPFLKIKVLVIAFAFAFSSYVSSGSASLSSVPRYTSSRHQQQVATSPRGAHHIFISPVHAPRKAPAIPAASSQVHSSTQHHHAQMWPHGFSSSPEISFHKHHHGQKYFPHSRGPVYGSPRKTHHEPVGKGPSPTALPPWHSLPPSTSHYSPSHSPSLSPTAMVSSGPSFQHSPSPSGSSMKRIPASPIMVLPSPPPNGDCTAITCTKPFTSSPVGYPCGCVRPIQVSLCLDVALYSFFPLVSELTSEVAASLLLNHSQVRVMGANAASQWLEKTIALIDLVPLEEKFDYAVAFSTYQKFWHKKVYVNSSLFGAYKVLYVHYPGLPPSPPSISPDFAAIDEHRFPFNGNGGGLAKPLGVDLPRLQKKKHSKIVIAAVVLSAVTAFLVCMVVVWILILKRRSSVSHPKETAPSLSSLSKVSGAVKSLALASGPQSVSSSSGALTFAGTAKIFSISEIERATDGFDPSRVLGEGGFGVVYSGILNDGEQVAVKVLKRDDRQGAREFLAEVEMLSRLHHRNLVKLIGICREDQFRCLVYELVPNGSVESHLHGFDKELAPLDWETRMKVALGAARGLAYLHEDSSPCVIHRDFKSSNILLEHDFTPKVSDFGLARAAMDEGNKYISTQVMGTFGYLAPEYAMTGHLLVKSDVYSYGVVLLELLTGRKPVDLSRPQGQENLVAWARPFLTNKDALESIVDPALNSTIPVDSLSKVAAIASMCVSPEVSRRPFMGEVVQALKLVCSEFDDCKKDVDDKGRSSSRAFSDLSVDALDLDGRASDHDEFSRELTGFSHIDSSLPRGYDSSTESRIALSTSNLKSESTTLEEYSLSLRRHFSSGPLGVGKKRRFWQRFKGFASERGLSYTAWPGSH